MDIGIPPRRYVERKRRLASMVILAVIIVGALLYREAPAGPSPDNGSTAVLSNQTEAGHQTAAGALETLPVKGRAPKTGYSRQQFGNGWIQAGTCTMRDRILARDFTDTRLRSDSDCTVMSGTLHDPYTGKTILFNRSNSSAVQIDHVVALSDAWQKGAQQLPRVIREQLANDPLELLAVDGAANSQKGDGDAATWLPSNKPYRCRYVARQIAVKSKYNLWVTTAERDAMRRVLGNCPQQVLPVIRS